jgi:nitrite reductase/ring-hydroxylating ferredoxin subunit
MAFERLASLAELKPGTMTDFELGDRLVVICNVGGEVHAMDGRCPHRGGPLGQGALHGQMVVCPWHAWEFDCVTGQNDYNPELRQTKYAVRLDGSDILVDL